ncbi:hypothetical protein PC119_g11774 [Phytophthora cactorum]|nr:hypothetical protein PC119_g11774 [Phytophthora cactorum]KAG3168310.1 hypothetical protein C6341_g11369 [Phytophthora cactorum]
MSFDDVDDVKNGFLLIKPLHQAFNQLQIGFIYDQSSNKYRLKVFDPSVRPQRLFGTLDRLQREVLLRGQPLPKHWRKRGRPTFAPGTDFNLQTTFGNIEGQKLCFMSVERPYKSCLNFQARVARKKAIEEKWIQPHEADFEEWSEGMLLAERMGF